MDFLESFRELSGIGATPDGGVDRPAATREDGRARDWFRSLLHELGATVHVDRIGNVFGLFDWVPNAPCVLSGSHLDSQPAGGRFDGAYGVLASLAAARRLDREVQAGEWSPATNLVVVDWTNEEGARFQPSVMGSSVFTGALSLDDALASRDAQGTRVADALDDIGFRGSDDLDRDVVAYAEIHVEQGSRLEEGGAQIGLVTGSWAAFKYDVRFDGEQSHTGATPMAERRDALLAAARVITGVHDLAEGVSDFHTSATGVECRPGSPNVVTALATLHVELRAPAAATLRQAEERFLALLGRVERELRVAVSITRQWHREATRYWPAGVDLATRCAATAGLSSLELQTISGHDSIALNGVVPTVMLFAPSAGGWAHNAKELTLDVDMQNGVDMMTEVLRALCTQRTGGGTP